MLGSPIGRENNLQNRGIEWCKILVRDKYKLNLVFINDNKIATRREKDLTGEEMG